jgi:hypothetical protein
VNAELEALRDEVRRSVHGDAWHGTALLEALDAFSAADAGARPIPSAHSPWEIALHTVAWTEEVSRRLGGQEPALPERGDWPSAPEPEESAWALLREEVIVAHSAVAEALAAFPFERLDEVVGGQQREPPLGDGTSYRVMLHGLAQHNAYHTGQLLLLRRALATA